MAKIRDVAVTIEAAAVASSALEMPVHETGDLLLCLFNKDTAGSGPSLPSGWSNISGFSNPLNTAGSGNYAFAKRATSSAETLTLTYTSETSLTAVIAIRDVNGSTVADAIGTVAVAASDDSTLPFTG
ncbi:MAG TPA: hypothetical protein PLB26_17145, partial [Rubrivivax sp.]|nr:hypothetical protein [Rubrivivax sp.]